MSGVLASSAHVLPAPAPGMPGEVGPDLARRREGPVAGVVIGALTAYQHTLSRLLGPRCRFYPSCSEYAKECFRKYPLTTAARKTGWRLARCHPFHPGGLDLP